MGFNKRYFSLNNTIRALKKNDLESYFKSGDILVFQEKTTSYIHELFKEGKSEQEIINILNINLEEQSNEMYQSNQSD